ncbi:Uncharacterised protein [Mycobacteroides abscessus subsp. abscessus]|nr:Uncharacterised protein [Mycobacteroides abscessus subsp. abscessus]
MTVSPGSSSTGWVRLWKPSTTWNNGFAAPTRPGATASTTRSKGRSAWAKAARSVSRAAVRRSVKRASGSTSVRRVRVLTNMPTRSSSARSPRPATGVPTAMSDSPPSRASSAASRACTTMNSEAWWARASSASAAWISAGSANRTEAPRVPVLAVLIRSWGRIGPGRRLARRSRQ